MQKVFFYHITRREALGNIVTTGESAVEEVEVDGEKSC